MSESEVKDKTKKPPRKRKVTGEPPSRKSPRLASIQKLEDASTRSSDSKIKKPKPKTSVKKEVPKVEKVSTHKRKPRAAPKKPPGGSKKKDRSEEESEETYDMSEDWAKAETVYDFTVRDIKGEEVSLDKYRGYVLLIVNVASKCGYTSSNYAQLVQLDEKYRDKGLRILAFPCNQFGHQEPGSADDICAFTKKKNVNFDIFEKIDVNGKNAHPLYKFLKKQQPGTLGDFIKWNFTKFIVDKDGKPVERHAPSKSPESLIPNIEKYLSSNSESKM